MPATDGNKDKRNTRNLKPNSNIRILNKKAKFEYIILDRYTAGIQLFGTEIKSIREGKASLTDSYCAVEHGEMYVKQMHIAEYRFGSYANHEAKRDRKLLLQRREIRKLEKATKDTGKTIIPLELFINEKGFAKMEIALCQGKHTYDKRQSLREADDKRQMDQLKKRIYE
ncbi:MAG: SsrA-binding protein SmpB [Paludibacteraceae bacterium]|nr:SsrA-binding protein SmpB [Paludibacteraceae bacterium]